MKTKIAILGSTGSIGKYLVDIISKDKEKFDVILLTANKNYKTLLGQAKKLKAKNIILANDKKYYSLKNKIKKINFFNNFNELDKIFKSKADYIMSAITGIDGLEPTFKSIKHTKKIAIANKESIICAWNLINKELIKNKTEFVPVDSEHFSIWSVLKKNTEKAIDKVYITASGGPFYNLELSKFSKIKVKDATKHPNWNMGKKISIDSSNLMNKILELIEAYRLFSFNPTKYEIIIHPQSLIHAIVIFKNGQSKFLYHETDMKIPISNAIYNNRVDINKIIKTSNNFIKNLKNIKFENVDKKRFPIVTLAKEKYLSKSGPIILNASNEILVDSFIKNKIPYDGIYETLKRVFKDRDFNKYAVKKVPNINEIYKIDNWARNKTLEIISKNYEKYW